MGCDYVCYAVLVVLVAVILTNRCFGWQWPRCASLRNGIANQTENLIAACNLSNHSGDPNGFIRDERRDPCILTAGKTSGFPAESAPSFGKQDILRHELEG